MYLPIIEPLVVCTLLPKRDLVTMVIEYPVLPAGVATPSKSDSIGWVKATLRSVLNQINDNSIKHLGFGIVVCLEYSEGLHITMTGHWGTLPAYVRDTWLQELYRLYTKLMVLYDVNPDHLRVTLYPYDKADEIIGYRSPYKSSIEGGFTISWKRDTK